MNGLILRMLLGALLVIGSSTFAPSAMAHKASDSYLTLTQSTDDGHRFRGRWDIALRDLDRAIGLDANGDGHITWGEVRARHRDIAAYALSRLSVRGDGMACPLEAGRQLIDNHTDGAYTVLLFVADCQQNIPGSLAVNYHLLFDIDPSHRGILTLRHQGRTGTAVLSPDSPRVSLELDAQSYWRQFSSFLMDGIWHIWTGYDHILFLLSLLLPSVLIFRAPPTDESPVLPGPGGAAAASPMVGQGEWQAAPSLRKALVEVVKVISAFTLSHTLTLSLAVLGIVALPSRWVEAAIAASVMVAAANNIWPVVRSRIWLVAFAFGFIHGLGFASALAGLALPPAAMALAIGGFNIGVEVGQEAIVLAVMPLAFLLRGTRLYQFYILRLGSIVIVLLALVWFLQRACPTLWAAILRA